MPVDKPETEWDVIGACGKMRENQKQKNPFSGFDARERILFALNAMVEISGIEPLTF